VIRIVWVNSRANETATKHDDLYKSTWLEINYWQVLYWHIIEQAGKQEKLVLNMLIADIDNILLHPTR
jgi:predicted DNA-binding ribbon-helix-helix protein